MTVSTAIPAGSVAAAIGVKTAFTDLRGGVAAFLPQQVALIGQGNDLAVYTTDAALVTTAAQVGQTYGFGSPLHLAAKQLFPVGGDGVAPVPVTVYPLDPDGGGVASDGDITPTGTMTSAESYQVRVGSVLSETFTLAIGDTVADAVAAIVAAVNAILDVPMIAVDTASTSADFTSKWLGASANDITLEVIGAAGGITFAITQPVNGAANPDVDDALANIDSEWESIIINTMEAEDTTTLDKFDAFNEGRWLPQVRKPAVIFTGNAEAVAATLIIAGDARKADRSNSFISAPGSDSLPLEIAARGAARVAATANANPPVEYRGKRLTGILPGAESVQWDYTTRDQLVKAGISTSKTDTGVVALEDTVLFYHPDGEEPPAFRYVVDVMRLQSIIFSLNLIFEATGWLGAPLIPDTDPTTNPAARRPKDAHAAVSSLVDSLGLAAIISDPAFSKTTIVAEIDGTNPNRLNVAFSVKLSGNVNITSVDLNFGFFFGGN